ncbi:Serum paraoxonase/arylesterase 1 [Tolypocladium paradoxum]|uniref:Serum paraoxonase/arylesterase 1 n=1 Tax=Tolypocladium paradoxum TaxID=94208 RepID=A0A2S4LAQ1_9HYPO|nr:Serum paraoxonase/arylesterase 1 [Tolypocladium paradoxum]
MAARSFFSAPAVILIFAVLVAYLYGPGVRRTGVVLGLFRTPASTVQTLANDFGIVERTTHCEDLHYHEPSNLLFTACEDTESTRYSWFPALAIFDSPSGAANAQGSIKIIDPVTLQAQTLALQNFKGPFITHGIDVIDDPDRQRGEAVYIFAVNHIPNRDHYEKGDTEGPKSHSVVEVFHHIIGSNAARHIRSVWDPLMRTPNDVLGISPTSFFVTNDHYYEEGIMRTLEDLYFGTKWSTTIFVEFSGAATDCDGHGVEASLALDGLHNNNGLAHGRTPQEVLVASCSSGVLHLGINSKNKGSADTRRSIRIIESLELDSTIDNPSYFADPYANSTFDASGFVLGGLSKAANLLRNIRDPDAKDGVMVWKVTPLHQGQQRKHVGGDGDNWARWSTRLLFEDDGSRIRTASSAVLVAIDPSKDDDRRRARLFVTGFLSKNIVAVNVDL